jgi:predicted restriction endonuclease
MKPKEILIRRWQFPAELKLFSFTDETSIEDFQVWCMATFSVENPRIYFLSNKTDWETREKIVDTESMLNFFSYSIGDKKRISQIIISCEQTTPTKAPVNFDSASEMSIGSVKVSSTLSRGDFQTVFRNQVLSRDKNLCVFCGSIESLEAAHIFNVKDGGDESSYAKLGKLHLHTLYDIGNGITLCYDCHKLFDWHLCSVHIEDDDSSKVFVVATDALLESSDENEKVKWNNLHGKLVNIPDDPLELSRNWPLASLFSYRESEFVSSNSERRQKNKGKVL